MGLIDKTLSKPFGKCFSFQIKRKNQEKKISS